MAAGILSRREPDQELVDPHLEQGSLVAIGREVSRVDRGYWMVSGALVSKARPQHSLIG